MTDPAPQFTPLSNVFAPAFLESMSHEDDPVTASEAVNAGPWNVAPTHERREWAVVRAQVHDQPEAVFSTREAALLFAAVLPGIGREPLFLPDPQQSLTEGRHGVLSLWGEQGYKPIGWTRAFDQSYAEALHVVEAIVRDPLSLSYLIEAAGHSALVISGRVLAERWRRRLC